MDASTASYASRDEHGRIQPGGRVALGADGRYAFTVLLQAARRGHDSNGRRYVITVRARDDAGNSGAASRAVIVPHDMGPTSARTFLE